VTTILLKAYRTQFQGAPLSSSYNYLKQLLLSQLPNNPIITHETDAKHLRDPAFLGAALKWVAPRSRPPSLPGLTVQQSPEPPGRPQAHCLGRRAGLDSATACPGSAATVSPFLPPLTAGR
jgi:hypothetical protein